MRLIIISIIYLSFFSTLSFSQSKMEDDINTAYQNAKKGVYWALANISDRKSKLDEDLVADDKMYASVKLEKVIDGIKVESTGFNFSNEVKITVYKSNEALIKEGYLKPEDESDKTGKRKK